MWKIDGLFAEAKDNHGLARAKYRGRAKVQIQAYLTATVQNLKRLVFLLLLRYARNQIRKAKQRTRFNFSSLNLFNTPHPLMISAGARSRCRHARNVPSGKSERCDNEGGAPETRIDCFTQVLTPRGKAIVPVHGPVVTARPLG
jgi:hypothetical protein